MALVKENDHVGKGLGRILEILSKPKIRGWIASYLAEVQQLEDAAFQVLTLRLLDAAAFEQLDVLGRLVGQARGSYSDAAYRAFIRARIRVNRSAGETDTLLAILALLFTDEAVTASFREDFPAAIVFILNAPLAAIAPADVFTLLQAAKADGVRLTLEYETAEPTFAFLDYAGPAVVAGLGDSSDPSVGGTFATVLST